ncbi:TPA: hypothetical protein ACKOSN_000631 [Clostridioides difficile]|uniref:hypothetical protein n=1 Tax=Clostridioides difficile TaxID=1496 RepID=UPI0010B49AB0|nr:hypothetical protein [Clostridioides difficile]UUV16472.1 hypothetical protein NQ183_09330 [Clostridioides difficile]VHY39836.1 Uncharacterised protein [Clostridioides difficile]
MKFEMPMKPVLGKRNSNLGNKGGTTRSCACGLACNCWGNQSVKSSLNAPKLVALGTVEMP